MTAREQAGSPILQSIRYAPEGAAASASFSFVEQLITASVATSAIPLGVTGIIFAVSLKVITTITGSGLTGFNVGDTSNGAAHWGARIALSAGTTNAGIESPRPYYHGTTVLLIAAVGGTSAGGAIRVSAMMMTVNPSTS